MIKKSLKEIDHHQKTALLRETRKKLIKDTLGQENMVVVFDEEKGMAYLPTKIICICEWDDKSVTSFVTNNTLYDIYDGLDEVYRPIQCEKIWAAEWIWSDEHGEDGYVDTSSEPTLIKSLQTGGNGPTWKFADPKVKPYLIHFWPPVAAVFDE